MSVANPTHFWRYLRKQLRLGRYLQQPGDGRVRPVIPARDLLRALLFGQLLRASSFHSIEALVRSAARRALGVTRRFGDDALAYFSERLDVSETRAALLSVLRQAKRGKAFDNAPLLGLALDGTTAGRCRKAGCALCRPLRNKAGEVLGYRHHLVMISIVGTGLSLPFGRRTLRPRRRGVNGRQAPAAARHRRPGPPLRRLRRGRRRIRRSAFSPLGRTTRAGGHRAP